MPRRGTRKSVFSIAESLRLKLEALYAPSQARFEALLRAGRVADRPNVIVLV